MDRTRGFIFYQTSRFYCDESVQNVCDVVQGDGWNIDKVRNLLPDDFANYILENIKPLVSLEVLDKPFWMLESSRVFSVKSSWEYLRRRNEP